jgi:chromosome segregation ATPase
LELQLSRAHDRERELTELAVRDGNQVATLQAQVRDLSERAERTDAAEQALFDAENRAETALRRAELMESELTSTRAEVDRLRTRVVELEASLRRALAEVGAATAQRAQRERDVAEDDAARLEASAERSLELADRLRLKVADLEVSLRTVLQEAGQATAAADRAEQAQERLEEAATADQGWRTADEDARAQTTEAEGRLEDLERRLSSLDERIAGLSRTPASTDEPEAVVDLRPAEAEAEAEAQAEAQAEAEAEQATEATEPAQGEQASAPASRWSEWRAT